MREARVSADDDSTPSVIRESVNARARAMNHMGKGLDTEGIVRKRRESYGIVERTDGTAGSTRRVLRVVGLFRPIPVCALISYWSVGTLCYRNSNYLFMQWLSFIVRCENTDTAGSEER